MRLMQIAQPAGGRAIVATEAGESWIVAGAESVYALARQAAADGIGLAELVVLTGRAAPADPAALLAEARVLPPVDHIDPAHVMVSGTGLTHLGSAATRDAMHQAAEANAEDTLTDSMKMFRMGLEGGKPAPGRIGVQPEWFFKGDGSILTPPGAPLVSPPFATDAGEEPEVAGIYLIGDDGAPMRLGFALCNEFSDHVMERENYLWLAHSKLRPCALGPELLLGELPHDIQGVSRIRRGAEIIFEKAFRTGEANMSHTVANLEAHHFKYAPFRRPGDVHIHSFGTATLSFADEIGVVAGDVFEIEAPEFGLALANPLALSEASSVPVRAL